MPTARNQEVCYVRITRTKQNMYGLEASFTSSKRSAASQANVNAVYPFIKSQMINWPRRSHDLRKQTLFKSNLQFVQQVLKCRICQRDSKLLLCWTLQLLVQHKRNNQHILSSSSKPFVLCLSGFHGLVEQDQLLLPSAYFGGLWQRFFILLETSSRWNKKLQSCCKAFSSLRRWSRASSTS